MAASAESVYLLARGTRPVCQQGGMPQAGLVRSASSGLGGRAALGLLGLGLLWEAPFLEGVGEATSFEGASPCGGRALWRRLLRRLSLRRCGDDVVQPALGDDLLFAARARAASGGRADADEADSGPAACASVAPAVVECSRAWRPRCC